MLAQITTRSVGLPGKKNALEKCPETNLQEKKSKALNDHESHLACELLQRKKYTNFVLCANGTFCINSYPEVADT